MVFKTSLFFLVYLVFCHLFRQTYFNHIKDIKTLMTDFLKPSFMLFVNLIPSNYLKQ